MAQLDAKGLMKACQALNARISSRDWPGATREIIEIYLDEAERSKAPDDAIERACIAYWGEQTFFRIFGDKSRRNIREAMRRAATEFACDPPEVADNPEVRPDDLASQLRWFSEKKKWPKGLEGMPELLAKAAEAVSAAPAPAAVDVVKAMLKKSKDDLHERKQWGGPTIGAGQIEQRILVYEDVISALSENVQAAPSVTVKELHQQRRMIVSHATMGRTDGEGQSVNDICVTITKLRNELYQEAQKSALDGHVPDVTESKPLDLNITKEWFEKRAALESDHEIGVGRRKLTASIDPTGEELAELHRLAHRIPEGWQLVPIEPTQEMCEAAPSLPAIDAINDLPLKKSGWSMSAIVNRKRYLAMLAAASAKREG